MVTIMTTKKLLLNLALRNRLHGVFVAEGRSLF